MKDKEIFVIEEAFKKDLDKIVKIKGMFVRYDSETYHKLRDVYYVAVINMHADITGSKCFFTGISEQIVSLAEAKFNEYLDYIYKTRDLPAGDKNVLHNFFLSGLHSTLFYFKEILHPENELSSERIEQLINKIHAQINEFIKSKQTEEMQNEF